MQSRRSIYKEIYHALGRRRRGGRMNEMLAMDGWMVLCLVGWLTATATVTVVALGEPSPSAQTKPDKAKPF
jgi:uncharacterized protein (DUF1684 family)